MPPQEPHRRRRSNSIKQTYAYLKEPPTDHHLQHLKSSGAALSRRSSFDDGSVEGGYVEFATTDRDAPVGPVLLRWLQRPGDSFLVVISVVVLYFLFHLLYPDRSSFLDPFISVTGRIQEGPERDKYRKEWTDLLFLPFWVVVFSFCREAVARWVVGPLASKLGVTGVRKIERFQEQGYAVIYFFCSSIAGLYVMSQQDSWWYRTEHFWTGYPHWAMPGAVKTYYLTQLAYWLQQALVMMAGLEKPRDDYYELVVHHAITLWLISASYLVNLTQIGIAIFVSMDIPDFFLAISKCINYVGLEKSGNSSFLVFLASWFYLRHYQNIRILASVWFQFSLIPKEARVWDPREGRWMPDWMRYQIFAPILALQLVIVFWSYLILRIAWHMLLGKSAYDTREEDEEEVKAPSVRKGVNKRKQPGALASKKNS